MKLSGSHAAQREMEHLNRRLRRKRELEARKLIRVMSKDAQTHIQAIYQSINQAPFPHRLWLAWRVIRGKLR